MEFKGKGVKKPTLSDGLREKTQTSLHGGFTTALNLANAEKTTASQSSKPKIREKYSLKKDPLSQKSVVDYFKTVPKEVDISGVTEEDIETQRTLLNQFQIKNIENNSVVSTENSDSNEIDKKLTPAKSAVVVDLFGDSDDEMSVIDKVEARLVSNRVLPHCDEFESKSDTPKRKRDDGDNDESCSKKMKSSMKLSTPVSKSRADIKRGGESLPTRTFTELGRSGGSEIEECSPYFKQETKAEKVNGSLEASPAAGGQRQDGRSVRGEETNNVSCAMENSTSSAESTNRVRGPSKKLDVKVSEVSSAKSTSTVKESFKNVEKPRNKETATERRRERPENGRVEAQETSKTPLEGSFKVKFSSKDRKKMSELVIKYLMPVYRKKTVIDSREKFKEVARDISEKLLVSLGTKGSKFDEFFTIVRPLALLASF